MKPNVIFNIGLLLALLLGGILGALSLPFVNEIAQVISRLFLNMLKLISLPMIFLAIVSTLTQMKSLSEAGFLLKKIFKYTLATTLIAAALGLILFVLIEPVKAGEVAALAFTPAEGSYLSFVTQIIPPNLIQPFIENNVIGMAFIATVVSFAIIKLPEEKGGILRDFFGALFAAVLKIASSLILVMPIGIFAFTILFVENMRTESERMHQLLFYGICVIVVNLIQGFVILPLLLKWKGQSPKRVAKAMLPALTMAFFSKSSNATLPLTFDCAKNRLGISDKTASLSLPMCSVINMNGCASFILITVLFVCTSEGMSFTIWEMIPWIFLSTIAAIGNAGVPMGCFFITTAFLMGMGVPLELMGLILPLYSIFDMVETALNVWSDSCITVVVDQELRAKTAAQDNLTGLAQPLN